MANRPTISVLIAAYNAAGTLAATIGSLCTQSLPAGASWQAIIVDDGSTDATAELARTMIGDDSRFTLICQANQGVAGARNTALQHAAGSYTLLLDADDVLLVGGLAALLATATAAEGSMAGAYGSFLMSAASGTHDGGSRTPLLLQTGRHAAVAHAELLASVFFAVHAVITPTHLAQRAGFDTLLPAIEDTDYFLRVAELGCVWHRTEAAVAEYCVSPASRSFNFSAMQTGTRLVYSRAYERAGLPTSAAEPLLHKADLAALCRQFLAGQVTLHSAQWPAHPDIPLEGAVLGHLSAAACVFSLAVRPGLGGPIGETLLNFWRACVAGGHAERGAVAAAALAIEARLATLDRYLATQQVPNMAVFGDPGEPGAGMLRT